MERDAFFTVHKDLPRQGPGEPADVHWALGVAGVSANARVLDAGCGPGADIVTLADALPDATITGIDAHQGFVDEAQVRTAHFGARVTVRHGDMADPGGPYDFIWCAGALYFLGVTEGLTRWKSVLASDGHVAFSEPVLLDGPQPHEVAEFWADYPHITDLEGIKRRVKNAGYAIDDVHIIVGPPWARYYDPLMSRIAELRAAGPSPALKEALAASAQEAALWASAPRHIAYALLVVHPE